MDPKKEYAKRVALITPKSKLLPNSIQAFLVGGLICAFGQILTNGYAAKMAEKDAKAAVSITLIVAASLLTAIGVFDKIAKFAGAGTLVPITGFANAVVSPAIEFKREGLVFGVAVKLFTVAGPVIVYGTVAAMIYGFVYWCLLSFGVIV